MAPIPARVNLALIKQGWAPQNTSVCRFSFDEGWPSPTETDRFCWLLGKGISGEKPKPNSGVELIKETNEQTRRDSLLFEEVSQGLEKLDATGPKVEDRCELNNVFIYKV